MLKIGILGYGTVGSGVDDIIKNIPNSPFVVTKIFDLESKRPSLGDRLFTNIEDVVNDPQIDVIVETLGGLDFPYEAITKAQKAGKHVVTSNKEVVAEKLIYFMQNSRKSGKYFLFEASVGGGIPCIHELCKNSKFDSINEIHGILNGTSNFVLTQIFDKGLKICDAIKMAQDLGYAEKDPTNDLEGLDLYRKILILSEVVLNKKIEIKNRYVFGLSGLNDNVINYVKKANKTIRYLCFGDFVNKQLIVVPSLVDIYSQYGNIKGATNIVSINCQNNGNLSYIGQGAGKYPTASSIVKDLYEILNNNNYVDFNGHDNCLFNEDDLIGDYVLFKNDEIFEVTNPKNKDLNKADFVLRKL